MPLGGEKLLPIRSRKTHLVLVSASKEDFSIASPTEANDQLDKRHEVRSRRQQRLREQATYKAAAMAASIGVMSLASFATYYRIWWHLDQGEAFPYVELASTLALVCGGMTFMEYYARWAHKSLWHDAPLGWALHKSHHEPREGPFEANDIFAVMNALPAMSLCMYGFLRPDVVGGLCFGAGLGITLFGISYMVCDGVSLRGGFISWLERRCWIWDKREKKNRVAQEIVH